MHFHCITVLKAVNCLSQHLLWQMVTKLSVYNEEQLFEKVCKMMGIDVNCCLLWLKCCVKWRC